MPNIFINILHLHYLEGKDGEGEDDDGGDAGRNDHSVRVILHAHLFALHMMREYCWGPQMGKQYNYHAKDDSLRYCECCQ